MNNQISPEEAFKAATKASQQNKPDALQFAVMISHGKGETRAPIFAGQNGVTIHPLMEKILANKNIKTIACFHETRHIKSVYILSPLRRIFRVKTGNKECNFIYFFTSDITILRTSTGHHELKTLNPNMIKMNKSREEILEEWKKKEKNEKDIC